jgi:hypothetical protein
MLALGSRSNIPDFKQARSMGIRPITDRWRKHLRTNPTARSNPNHPFSILRRPVHLPPPDRGTGGAFCHTAAPCQHPSKPHPGYTIALQSCVVDFAIDGSRAVFYLRFGDNATTSTQTTTNPSPGISPP